MSGTLGHDAGGLRFESPPVQQVVLSIFFKPLFALRTSQLIPIIGQWSDSYPHLDELPHMHTWRALTSDEASDVVSLGRPAPTPLFVLHSNDRQRSLQVQQDRFELVWRFEAGGSQNEYVGYSSLRTELQERFTEFADSVSQVGELNVVPERADATYQNLVDIPVRDFCVGVLTSWESDKSLLHLASEYSGMRLGGIEGLLPDGGDSIVMIDPGPDGQGTDFTLDIQCPVQEQGSYLTSLDEAHRVALELFTNLAGSGLLESWGRRQ